MEEEAALESAVERKRQLAVLQASRISNLERCTAELLRRRDAAIAVAATSIQQHAGRSESGGDSPLAPSAVVANHAAARLSRQQQFGMPAGIEAEEDIDSPTGEYESLESVTEQVEGLKKLQQQVACLEDELETRTQEVEKLTAQIGALDAVAHSQKLGAVT